MCNSSYCCAEADEMANNHGCRHGQKQPNGDANVLLDRFGVDVMSCLWMMKPHQICDVYKWCLSDKHAEIRQQDVDLILEIVTVMKLCKEEPLMGHIDAKLYDYLSGEIAAVDD
ncbi:unnamed protein product [Dovyalis caffra]|uniref:Uncharacterized protein n=1 Tax=Dovyalis caffra TaxID=77055 RepID=A0AAV1S1F2_9ROSI|nr:unnamed protein product [Dovyalis caffra]